MIGLPGVRYFNDKYLPPMIKKENEMELNNGPMYHEISHIVNQDSRTGIFTKVMRTVVPLMVLKKFSMKTALFTAAGMHLWYIVMHRLREKRADIEGSKIMGTSASMIRHFECYQKRNREFLKSLPWYSKMFCATSGDNYWDITHPLLSTRIQYLQPHNNTSTRGKIVTKIGEHVKNNFILNSKDKFYEKWY